jgi:hypothetical protein
VLLPPWWGKGGMGEKGGRSAPLMRTPTPPSPVEGEGPAQRLTTTFVPKVLTFPRQGGRGLDLPLSASVKVEGRRGHGRSTSP